jgi:Fe-only nitrogenase accessory protein AnfO
MEIAVLVNDSGETSGFERDGTIRVYSNDKDVWVIKKYMEYSTQNITNAAILREKIKEICVWLMDCKILVVNRIRGVHYISFEENLVSMLEIGGKPENFLEDIKMCSKHQRTGHEIPLEPNAIYEAKPGSYYTDLREVMKGNTSYNSKQILVPFLKNRKYNSLEIICEHIPKWLEKEQSALKIMLAIENYQECIKVKVYPVKKR